MTLHNLSEYNSLIGNYIRELRDIHIQNDRMRFRTNVERIGMLLAYEISRTLHYRTENVVTPLGTASSNVIADPIVVAAVLRAALPLHNGILHCFDHAENAFVSAYRKYTDNEHFEVHTEYIAAPQLTGKTLILCDPMLATGTSMELAWRTLLTKGMPTHLHLASVIASRSGIDYMQHILPPDADLWVAAIDPALDAHAYIVPGLGDAGDLAFGEKE